MADGMENNNNTTPETSNGASGTSIIFARSFPDVLKIEVFSKSKLSTLVGTRIYLFINICALIQTVNELYMHFISLYGLKNCIEFVTREYSHIFYIAQSINM